MAKHTGVLLPNLSDAARCCMVWSALKAGFFNCFFIWFFHDFPTFPLLVQGSLVLLLYI